MFKPGKFSIKGNKILDSLDHRTDNIQNENPRVKIYLTIIKIKAEQRRFLYLTYSTRQKKTAFVGVLQLYVAQLVE